MSEDPRIQQAKDSRTFTCSRKVGYRSIAKARKSIHLQSNMPDKPSGLTPYQCPFCGLWHVGHTPKSWARARASQAQAVILLRGVA